MISLNIRCCISGFVVTSTDGLSRHAEPSQWAFSTLDEAMSFIRERFEKPEPRMDAIPGAALPVDFMRNATS